MRALLILVVVVGCKSSKEAPASAPLPTQPADAAVAIDATELAPVVIPETAPARKMWVPRIDDAATFEAYSKQIGNERFSKFVIDLDTDAIYYFDVSVYPVHKDFIFGALYKKPKTKEAVRVFDRNYGANKTDFMMCYLVHHLTQDIWTLAFWDGDLANTDHVRRAYKRMRESFYLGATVKYRPDSNFQESIAKKLGDVPYILNDQLYKLADYVAFNKGTAVGTLRIVPDVPESELVFAPDEIVILPKTLSDITPVAAIISETFTSPLAHVSLRAKGWGIPNVGLRGAQTKYADLAGKQVYFEANDAGHMLRAATDEEVAAATAKRAVVKSIEIPDADIVSTDLEPTDTMDKDDERRFGGKASNLGIIINAKLKGFSVPKGFGIPFHYFNAHLAAHGLDKKLAALLADPGDANARKAKLEALRKEIEKAEIDAALCTKIGDAIAKILPADASRGVFVRSSTNAEDLDNFSGAGLHDTKPNVKGTAAVCEAVKAVWASTWTLRAYEARKHAGIDQAKVYGAVLVQVAIAATSAGVVATIHPTDPTDDKNYTINAKSGLGIAVVDGRKIPESLIVSWYNHGIRVLSRSDEETRLVFDEKGGVREVPNEHRGKAVLTNKMAILLADTSRQLTKLFANNKLDIEWVYAGDELFIVQTRPLVTVGP
ncbi:MAG: PEP/pyruvate-binding domain-containing protein [Myxococcota bacterium]|nr:PEP/pyruvate-binding domain-containing protein [Myxococcota bacterium]